MDPVNIIQLAFGGTAVLVLGRVGLAVARYLERHLSGDRTSSPAGDDRLRAVEDECALLRQELSELQDRQDFTERVLQDPARSRLARPEAPEDRIVTPH